MVNRTVKANSHGLLQVSSQQPLHLRGITQDGDFKLFVLNQTSGGADLFRDTAVNLCAKILHVIAAKQAKQDGFHDHNRQCDLENQTANHPV